jgi:hypothetical protein
MTGFKTPSPVVECCLVICTADAVRIDPEAGGVLATGIELYMPKGNP